MRPGLTCQSPVSRGPATKGPELDGYPCVGTLTPLAAPTVEIGIDTWLEGSDDLPCPAYVVPTAAVDARLSGGLGLGWLRSRSKGGVGGGLLTLPSGKLEAREGGGPNSSTEVV